MSRILVTIAVAAMLAACNKDNPASPSGTVTISPSTDLIKNKSSESFTANAASSDGTTRAVQASWSSDATTVATVDSNGRVTGVGPGESTIAADYQGTRATRRLRVVPDYQGTWQGGWRLTQCASDGDWSRSTICQDLHNGDVFVLSLTLSQSRASVTGTIDLGDLPGPAQGSIGTGGQLALTSTFTTPIDTVSLETSISNWESLSLDNTTMTGRFKLTFREAGLQGSARLDGELYAFTKAANALTGSPRPLRQSLRLVARP